MIEPTESESKQELDRLVNALISIRGEIRDIEEGRADKADNVLKNAPHTAEEVLKGDADWSHPYSRQLVPASSHCFCSIQRRQAMYHCVVFVILLPCSGKRALHAAWLLWVLLHGRILGVTHLPRAMLAPCRGANVAVCSYLISGQDSARPSIVTAPDQGACLCGHRRRSRLRGCGRRNSGRRSVAWTM